MAKNVQIDITDESVHPVKAILWLAWPVLIEQILTTMVSYADTAMVGALGKNATASVSISNSPVFLINGIAMSLGVGITALIARSVGAGDYDLAKRLKRHAILMLVFIALPLCGVIAALSRVIPEWMGADEAILGTAAQYNLIVAMGRPFGMASMILNSAFRGCGDTKTPMRINLTVNILNVIGNYFLINQTHTVDIFGWFSMTVPGAGWGVAGAAAATAISMSVGGIAAIYLTFRKKGPTQIHFREGFKFEKDLALQITRISFPAMLERMCMSGAGIVVSRAIASLGTTVIAANSLYLTAESLSFMPGFAFQTAVTTLVGQSLGAGKPALAKRFTYVCCGIGAAALSVMGALLYIFAEQILSFFTPDQGVIEVAAQCLHIVAFLQPFQVAAWVFAGALRGAGDTKWLFYMTAISTWGVRTAGAFLMIRVFGFGLPEAVMCMFADGICRLVLFYLRFRTGKWVTILK